MSDRENDWLRYGLSEIAMKAAVPNLRERAVRTSRRHARRQLLGVSAAVVVLLLGGAALVPRLSASNAPVAIRPQRFPLTPRRVRALRRVPAHQPGPLIRRRARHRLRRSPAASTT